MRLATVIVIFCHLVFLSNAQTTSTKKKEQKFGCYFAINSVYAQVGYLSDDGLTTNIWGSTYLGGDRKDKSISLSIIPAYNLSKDLLIRFELSWTKISLINSYSSASSSFTSSSVRQAGSDTIKQKIYRYVPGLEYIYLKNKIIHLYCGVILPIIQYEPVRRNQFVEQRNVGTDTLVYWNAQSVSIPGGYSAGVGSLAGFHVFIFKHLSIGAEFSVSLLYNDIGGDVTYHSTGETISNSSFDETVKYPDSYRGIKFSKILSSFNIALFL